MLLFVRAAFARLFAWLWSGPVVAVHSPAVDVVTDATLLARLWTVVRREGIPVIPKAGIWSWRNGLDSAASYNSVARIIKVRPEFHLNPWVLAHELGHHFAITGRDDHSEEAADAEARRLVLSLLSEAEAAAMRWKIDIHYPKER